MADLENWEKVHLITGVGSDDHIKSENIGLENASFIGSEKYVVYTGNKLAITTGTNAVTIATGTAFVNGRFISVEKPTDLLISAPTSSKRIDTVVLRYKKESGIERGGLVVIPGTEASSPQATTDTYASNSAINGDSIVDFPLYNVLTDGSTLTITTLFSYYIPVVDRIKVVSSLPSTLGPDGTIYLVKA